MSLPGAIPLKIHANGTKVTACAPHPHPLCWAGSLFPPICVSARWPQLVQGCHELGEFSLPLPWSKGLVIVRGCRGGPRWGHHQESKGPRGHGDKGPIKLIQPSCWNFPPVFQQEFGGAAEPMFVGSLGRGGGPWGALLGGPRVLVMAGALVKGLFVHWSRAGAGGCEATARPGGPRPWASSPGAPQGGCPAASGGPSPLGEQDVTGGPSPWHWNHLCVLRTPRVTAPMHLGVPLAVGCPCPWHRTLWGAWRRVT